MPTRQETLFHFLKSGQKRKKKEEADADAKNDEDDMDKTNDDMPSTSKKTIKKGPKVDMEEIFSKPTKEAELRIKHHLFPNFNRCQLPVEDFSELQNFPSCTVSLPHPVHIADKHCESVDPCHRRTIARENYSKRLLHARTAYLNATKNSKKLRAAQKNEQYHNSLFEFAERLQMNPDPYFNSSFDFYYTGGNLCVLPDSSYVVHAGGKNLQELNISRLSNKKDMTTVPMRHVLCETLPLSGDIMQVMPFVTNREDRPNSFVTRQRNCISLYAYRGNETLKAITQYNNKSTPFISFAQSAVDRNKFVLTNMKQHVRLFDLNSSKTTLSKLYQVSEDDKERQWNIVKPWREHTFLYANTKEMFLMDLRTGPKEWYKTKCGFGDSEFFCENIASILPSEFKKQIYVGTSHKLYCLDTRCWGHEFEGPAAVCCWQHQLEYPPLLLETYRHFSSEYVALSSVIADDIRICELTRAGRIVAETPKKKQKLDEPPMIQKYHYKSLSLPYQPPTLHEAYESARLNGKCLRPYSNLQQRLNCSTTGIAFYANPEGKYEQTLLLTSNSNGDVFAHQFSQLESQENVPRTSALTDSVIAKYDETISKITQPDLNYTEVGVLKAMSKVFRCATLNSMKTEVNASTEETNIASDAGDEKDCDFILKRRHFGRWQKSMQVLHSYKDALVPNILSIWDIDYIAENDIKISELEKKLRIKPDPETMVNSWLERMNSEPPMTSVPAQQMNNSVTTDINLNASLLDELVKNDFSLSLLDLPQSTQLLDESATLFDTTLVEEQPNTSTLSAVADKNISTNTDAKRLAKTKKKRTTYVKGF